MFAINFNPLTAAILLYKNGQHVATIETDAPGYASHVVEGIASPADAILAVRDILFDCSFKEVDSAALGIIEEIMVSHGSIPFNAFDLFNLTVADVRMYFEELRLSI
jgi:hypothetical protein